MIQLKSITKGGNLMNENYDGTNQNDSGSSNPNSSSGYQNPSQPNPNSHNMNQQWNYGGQAPYQQQTYNNSQPEYQANTYNYSQTAGPNDPQQGFYSQPGYEQQTFNTQPNYNQQAFNNQQGYTQQTFNGQQGYTQQTFTNQQNYDQQTLNNQQEFVQQPGDSQQDFIPQPENTQQTFVQQQPGFNQSSYEQQYNQAGATGQAYTPSSSDEYNPFAANDSVQEGQPNLSYDQNNYVPYPNGTNNAFDSNKVTTNNKKHHKWIWGFTVIPVLAIAAVLCFFFIPSFKNFVYKHALGTTKYYEHIESSCTEKVKDELSDLPTGKKVDFEKGFTSKGSAKLNLDSSLTSSLGMDLSDFSCDYNVSAKDNKLASIYKLNYKGTELGSFELYSDSETGKMYLKLPNLSDQYLDYSALLNVFSSSSSSDISSDLFSRFSNLSAETTNDSSSDQLNTIIQKLSMQLTSDKVSELTTEYLKFIIDDIGDKGALKLNENENFRVGGLEQKCDLFTISLTEKQVRDLIIDVLKKAKDDQKLLDIVKAVSNNPDSFTSSIDELIESLNNSTVTDSNASFLQMFVYTDGQQILGRRFVVSDDGQSLIFEYGMLSTSKRTTFKVSLAPPDMSNIVYIDFDSKKDGEKSTGQLSLTTDDEVFTIDFSDVKANSDDTIEGKFSITESVYNLYCELSSKDGSQQITLGIKAAGQELGNITMEAKTEDVQDFSYPDITDDKVASITDKASLVTYLKDSKLPEFLDNIMKTLNLPTTVDGTTLANSIIAQIESGTVTNGIGSNITNRITDGQTPGFNSSYNPSDYNLPEGAEIDDYGYYSYDLSDTEIEALKKQGSDYKSFDKTYDEIKSFMEALAKSYCGDNAYSNTETNNRVYGSITDNNKSVEHFVCNTWTSQECSESVTAISDSLDNKVLELQVAGTSGDDFPQLLKKFQAQLGVAVADDATLKTMTDFIAAKKEDSKEFTLSDCTVSISITDYSGELEYRLEIAKDNGIY